MHGAVVYPCGPPTFDRVHLRASKNGQVKTRKSCNLHDAAYMFGQLFDLYHSVQVRRVCGVYNYTTVHTIDCASKTYVRTCSLSLPELERVHPPMTTNPDPRMLTISRKPHGREHTSRTGRGELQSRRMYDQTSHSSVELLSSRATPVVHVIPRDTPHTAHSRIYRLELHSLEPKALLTAHALSFLD